MVTLRRSLVALAILLLPTLVLGFVLATASAALPASQGLPIPGYPREQQSVWDGRGNREPSPQTPGDQLGLMAEPSTTLTVTILSSPWATVDANDPGGAGGPVPDVFVVQALISNTGAVTATDVTILLDYDAGEATGWVLVDGEDPERGAAVLGPGTGRHVYWLARYPATNTIASHQYTVTAGADNAPPVSTSDNAYGNPAPGATVQTVHALSTGNSGIVSYVSGDIVVGVPFTVSVLYDLGSNPDEVMFSPVGNPDFAAGAFRLIATTVHLFDDTGIQEQTFPDQLYFPTLPPFADNAEVTYTFLVIRGAETRLCSYADVGFDPNYKYDQFHCEGGQIIPLTGTLELELDKQGSSSTVQQGETLTYTLRYTNTGTWAMTRVWIWDDLDPTIGSVITSSISPPWYDADELQSNRLAWYVGDLPVAAGGTLTYAIRVDGGGQDLPDGLAIINRAFQGIGGNLPLEPAAVGTVTTTVEAPALLAGKTDRHAQVDVGDRLTYTLSITNDGSIAAVTPLITDLLPAYVVPIGPASPITDTQVGGRLVWSSLGPIPPEGGRLSITIPCQVVSKVPNETVLTNQMGVAYENEAGYAYRPVEAFDITAARAPVLEITKDATPDPVGNGAPLSYAFSYTNSGPVDATAVVVTDRVPISTTFVSCAGGLSCQEAGGLVTWLVGTVPSQTTGSGLELAVHTDAGLRTGDLVVNGDYGIGSDQTPYMPGPPVSVTVVRPAAVIEGHAFVDADGDGLRDIGEVGIPGVTITLPVALEPITVTDGDGYYVFRVEITTPVSITAGLPDDYFRTTPGVVWLEPVLQMVQILDFGYAPTTSPYGVIYGTVFEDTDTNGQQDGGEAGLAGVTVTSLEAVMATVTTNQLGQYTLRFSNSGAVTVTETNPPLYVSTTPDQISAVATVGSSGTSPVDFGDVQGVRLSGKVFLDLNLNGVDDSEPGIPGVTLALDGQISTTTDPDGLYAFLVEEGGIYVVTESDPAGYFSTTPNEVHVAAVMGGVYHVNFGDALETQDAATIFGTVFEDLDSDGEWDPDELGIAGVTVTHQGDVATTDAYGSYQFAITTAGEHTVVETDPVYYVSTTPNTVTLAVELGQGYQVDFGDTLAPSCSCGPDGYEEDDNWEDAAALSPDGLRPHDFCDDAVDWSAFEAQAGAVYTLTTISWGRRADTFLSLFDTDGETLLAANDDYRGTVDYSSRIVWRAPAPGTYYVRTTNRAALEGCITDYDLWLEEREQSRVYLPAVLLNHGGEGRGAAALAAPEGVINHSCPDDYEPDDTWEVARPLVDGMVEVHSFDSDPELYAADKDWLGFDLRSLQAVTLTIVELTNTTTLLELFDAQGALLTQTEGTELTWEAQADGHYYLAVSPLTTAFGCSDSVGYRLRGVREPLHQLFVPILVR